MATKKGWREVDANSNQSLTRFFTRTGGWEPMDVRMPFTEMLEKEDDGEDEPAGDYEIRQRMLGVKVFFDFILSRGATPMDLFRQLAAVGRGLHRPPFNKMTMHEIAMMEGQSAAAHSWRCKVLSGEIELAGMKGSRLPGQKSKAATESYKECRKGNNNRKGGKKLDAAKQGPKGRQGSFLKKLHVQPKPKKSCNSTNSPTTN